MTVGRVLSKNMFDLVGIQEVIWEKGVTEPAEGCTIYFGTWNKNCELGTVY
jgi:hypothetical protein